ncbi:tRNA preQ1(34) S-adenosylmethionine ribosyltransferase-isomerase QueA [Candidatus Aeolococcus gillhamiae]|uniref:tRNA preQ1(34) S-adenosylmethionine ribosyltransferase-isomerase QueA n=1 Tax=Candidatus Aeolococcus gillhamiae TaxID=3127015 RepID=UPI003077649E
MATVKDPARDRARALPTDMFDYVLPAGRIAQTPVEPRDASRLLHAEPGGGLSDHVFTDLPDLLRPGDLLVANDTRVRAARLRGRGADGGKEEVLLLTRLDRDRFTALVRPGRRLHDGARVSVGDALSVTIAGPAPGHPGARVVRLDGDGDLEALIAQLGEAPLPPYIRTPLEDAQRYQTVYAAGAPASAAAPTAGLHFTSRVHEALAQRGVGWTALQLDVGLGTFAPITVSDARTHRMHAERCMLPAATAATITAARAGGGRVIAVGTTVVRTLESFVDGVGALHPGTVSTELFITPGHRFGAVDGLLTNFHQPRSSLLVLLAAFLGGDAWRSVYEHALARGYRFLSFGDCMLCWRGGAPS